MRYSTQDPLLWSLLLIGRDTAQLLARLDTSAEFDKWSLERDLIAEARDGVHSYMVIVCRPCVVGGFLRFSHPVQVFHSFHARFPLPTSKAHTLRSDEMETFGRAWATRSRCMVELEYRLPIQRFN